MKVVKSKSPKTQAVRKLNKVIDESLSLLVQADINEHASEEDEIAVPSLLDKCLELCEQHNVQTQEPLRTIHHFGLPSESSLLSCLATIVNTQVLSDIHPNNHSFKNTIKRQSIPAKKVILSNQAESDIQYDEYLIKVFLNDLQQVQQQSTQVGQRLIICDNHCLSQVTTKRVIDLLTLLKRQFTLRSLIVVADPVDGYSVYCKNVQVDVPMLSFEEYCQSILDFIRVNSKITVIRHEDFMANPMRTMVVICKEFGMSPCEEFLMLSEVFINKEKVGGLFQEVQQNIDRLEIRRRSHICRRFNQELKQLFNTNFASEKVLKKDKVDRSEKNIDKLQKPVVRVIHHFSCTGGTLFSKCLAAQSNVVLLNEIDPFSKLLLNDENKPKFEPRDIISLMNQAGEPFDDNFIATLFRGDIKVILEYLSLKNKNLLLREHTHSTYLLGGEVRDSPLLHDILKESFDVKSIVTVRNPIDSYLSLQEFGWLHFKPATFNEYCFRYLCFLDDYKEVMVFKYEDLIEDSIHLMEKLCAELKIGFNANFVNNFSKYNFSGDSGRAGDVIESRERRQYSQEFVKEVDESECFKKVSLLLGYDSGF